MNNTDLKLSANDYAKLCEFVYDRTGIRFTENNRDFVEYRLGKRIKDTNQKDVSDYLYFMKYDASGKEMRTFFDLLTTNETFFHRDLPQLMVFVKKVMPLVLQRKSRDGNSNIRIWSAACSVGCEPLSLAILLREELPQFPLWRFEILATDISPSVLKVAQDGLYTDREIQFIPEAHQKKYFTRSGDYWKISAELKNSVKFSTLNLVDQKAMASMCNFDVVFCRNVLIYFDGASRDKVLDNLYESLVDGGYIFLGHSEFLSQMSRSFRMERIGTDIVYMKPE